MARPTVSKRLDAAGIKPSDKRGGHPVYRMRDVVRIFVDTPQHSGDGAEFVDPMRMRPTDRRAWFQSENERLKFEQEQGRLIPAGEVEAEMAEVAKIVTRALETLGPTFVVLNAAATAFNISTSPLDASCVMTGIRPLSSH